MEKKQNNGWNLFKVINEDTRTKSLTSLKQRYTDTDGVFPWSDKVFLGIFALKKGDFSTRTDFIVNNKKHCYIINR